MQILLHDGFQDERVIVRVNGKEVYQDDHVTSKKLTGMADRIEVPAPSGSASVNIEIRNLGLSETIEVDGDQYVAFYLEGGKLRHIVSDHPLGSA